jgi:hypothetical protein
MSYCRFSDDDYQSDVYVYESDEGIMIHVAGMRYIFDRSVLPEYVDLMTGDAEKYMQRHEILMDLIKNSARVKIGYEHDGKTFICEDEIEAVETLNMLRECGYHVPTSAMADLIEEACK